jgi:hypothetical protein
VALQPFIFLGRFFSFLIFYTFGKNHWPGDELIARPLPVHNTAPAQNEHTEASMPQIGLEPTILVFERGKTVHAFDRAATLTGLISPLTSFIFISIIAFAAILKYYEIIYSTQIPPKLLSEDILSLV